MATHRLFVLIAACTLCGQITLADSRTNQTNFEKTKRDLNIIGPIPTGYRGQATGQTTFDGILAADLQLPVTDSGQYRTQSASAPRIGARTSAATAQFGGFQSESGPDVYNFDGKEQVTYDGVLASDLMVPYAHVTVLNQQARSVQPQRYFRQRAPQTTAQQPIFQRFRSQPLRTVVRQANIADNYRGDLAQTSSASSLQAFQQTGTVPANADPSLFQPETPSERYNRLQQQYQATLAEYRNSLLRFQEQLKKYSSFSKKK